MALKSYRLITKKKKSKKKRKQKRKPTRDLITGGVTAIIGVGLLSETARAVNRI